MMTVERDSGAQGADTHYTHVFKLFLMSPSTAGLGRKGGRLLILWKNRMSGAGRRSGVVRVRRRK